jgi:hypothetical protein
MGSWGADSSSGSGSGSSSGSGSRSQGRFSFGVTETPTVANAEEVSPSEALKEKLVCPLQPASGTKLSAPSAI